MVLYIHGWLVKVKEMKVRCGMAVREGVCGPYRVTLEELYSGATKDVEYKRKELCKTCRG